MCTNTFSNTQDKQIHSHSFIPTRNCDCLPISTTFQIMPLKWRRDHDFSIGATLKILKINKLLNLEDSLLAINLIHRVWKIDTWELHNLWKREKPHSFLGVPLIRWWIGNVEKLQLLITKMPKRKQIGILKPTGCNGEINPWVWWEGGWWTWKWKWFQAIARYLKMYQIPIRWLHQKLAPEAVRILRDHEECVYSGKRNEG